MQRRTAAIYAALLLLLAAGSYATIGAVEAPVITIDSPEYSYVLGDQASLNNKVYTVVAVTSDFAELEWIDESIIKTETWEEDDTVKIGESEFLVGPISNADSITSTFILTEVRQIDDAETVTINSETYVIIQTDTNESSEPSLISQEDYLTNKYGPATLLELNVGDAIEYNSKSTLIVDISDQTIIVSWPSPKTITLAVSEGDVIDSNGISYVAHFENYILHLSSDVDDYERQASVIEKFYERINGLWGVSILGSLASILLLSMAYLSSRY